MDPQTAPQRTTGSESSRTTVASSNMSPAQTQLQQRHHLVHCHAAHAATYDMTKYVQVQMFPKTGTGRNKKQHAIRCVYICIEVDSRQLTI